MLASEASQENFEKMVFLTTKYEQIVKLEHLLSPKVGGHKPTCAPPLLKVGRHVPPPPPPPPPPCPPFSYALAFDVTLSMCWSHLNLSEISTPRYG